MKLFAGQRWNADTEDRLVETVRDGEGGQIEGGALEHVYCHMQSRITQQTETCCLHR